MYSVRLNIVSTEYFILWTNAARGSGLSQL